MDRKEVIDRANNPKYIRGISNYCDGWCERCRFTDRCRCYAMERENDRRYRTDENDPDAWVEKVTESLEASLEMLRNMAEEEGFDLDFSEDAEGPETGPDGESTVNYLVFKARAYADMVDDWFVDNADILVQSMEKWQPAPHLAVVRPESDEAGLSEEECLEIVEFYHYQIVSKLQRAVHGRIDESSGLLDGLPKDSDGSAKVALIGMDRSVEAWEVLAALLPEQKKALFAVVDFLKSLRQTTEMEFPDARAFVRPGFDEEES